MCKGNFDNGRDAKPLSRIKMSDKRATLCATYDHNPAVVSVAVQSCFHYIRH